MKKSKERVVVINEKNEVSKEKLDSLCKGRNFRGIFFVKGPKFMRNLLCASTKFFEVYSLCKEKNFHDILHLCVGPNLSKRAKNLCCIFL